MTNDTTENKKVRNSKLRQLALPVLPDGLVIRINGSFTHLMFISVLNQLDESEDVNVVADIASTPLFLLNIAEQCLAALRVFAPEAQLNMDEVERIRKEFLDNSTPIDERVTHGA